MLQIPQRSSLISQTASALRQAIESGLWQEALPGERELADRFQVSRPTLREALKVLQREKVIEVSHGKRRTILSANLTPRPQRLTVTAISQHPPHQMSPLVVFYMNELRRHMQKAGLELEVVADQRLRGTRPEKLLDHLRQNSTVACWILLSAPETVQRWFDQLELPALVAGSCYPGVRLPSLDLDYRAVCRHAVGILLGQGHRHVAFLTQAAKVAGDDASEEGFLRAVAESGHPEAKATILHHDGTREDICRRLARMMRSSSRPTGLLVSRPSHLLTAHTSLLQQGVSLPRDLSLISRDNDPYLAHVIPDVTRYTVRRRHFADRLARLVIKLATTGSVPRREYRLIPQLHAGATVAPPRT
jgi:DNA-binding LacI/PurR family transcriptional regulator/DNA-binding transcriptional regulator YhcF (GntR family)